LRVIGDGYKNVFGFSVVIVCELLEAVEESDEVTDALDGCEDASGRVFGFGSAMDAYAFSFGHLVNERQEFLETRRPCELEGISAGRYDTIGVLERVHYHGRLKGDGH
jgi:hypothetical protein